MGPAAHLAETQALIDFRAVLCTFADLARGALEEVEGDIHRTSSFLDEQLQYWTSAHRAAEDAVLQAKIELAHRKMQRIGDRQPDTSEQEKTLRRAQARLEFVEEKLASTRAWIRDFPNELTDYQGPARQLQSSLEFNVPRMVVFLEQKIAALESYLNS